ncbi:MAG: hypothetical protein C5B51_21810 [Terriglobia bacterium]|nr:MAG: hypothetical protein C5B51_21810 [Terriglobia bacterium]
MYRKLALCLGSLSLLAAAVPQFPVAIRQPVGFQQVERRRFVSHSYGRSLQVTPGGADWVIGHSGSKGSIVSMRLLDANTKAEPIAEERSGGTANYLLGNDRSHWRVAVPSFGRVGFRGVYRGIDLVYYGSEDRLEYDFRLAAGANPRGIRMVYSGAKRVRVDAAGDLVLSTGESEIRQHKPHAYQEIGGIRCEIPVQYLLRNHEVAFGIGRYDRQQPLVIDPALSFASFLGGSLSDSGRGITVDAAGNVYIAGTTYSTDFTVTKDVIQNSKLTSVAPDLFVSKLDSRGALIFSTYLGGNSGELFGGLAVDSSSNICIAATTDSTNLPTSDGVFQGYNRGGYFGFDGYVAKLDPTGAKLVFGTYLGGNDDDLILALALDKTGIYLAGSTASTNFPLSFAAFQKNNKLLNSFVTKLSLDGKTLSYSTLVGGTGGDLPAAIQIDSSGNAFVVGHTDSKDFPTTAGALQTVHNGGSKDKTDAFLYKLNSQGSQLIYSTLLGGSDDDYGIGLSLDTSGNAYVAGATYSTNFPVSKGVLQAALLGLNDGFVAKINPSGSALVFCTLLGGTRSDIATGIFTDRAGNMYVTGSTASSSFPVLAPFQAGWAGGADGFAIELDPAATKVLQGSLIGGSGDENVQAAAMDGEGNIYLLGDTASPNFPVTRGAAQTRYGGGSMDAFVAKVSFSDASLALSVSPDKLTFQGTVNSAIANQALSVTSVGGALVGWKADVTTGSAWLGVTPKSSLGSGNIIVSVNASGLSTGAYTGSIIFANQMTGAQVTIPVTLTLAAPPPAGGQITTAGVLNGAGYQAGPLAPGEIITIFGTGIGPLTPSNFSVTADGTLANVLADTRVWFDNVAAPLVYVSASQMSAIVPYAVSGQTSTQLQVEYKSAKSNALALAVAPCAPAIFTADSSGSGQAAVNNQDGTSNSKDNPAERNSVITFFGTGEGQTDPAGVDGKLARGNYPKPVLPYSLQIGGATAEVLYFGAAPDAVAGLFQANARIPDGAPSGNQPLIMRIGNCISREGVTVAVK